MLKPSLNVPVMVENKRDGREQTNDLDGMPCLSMLPLGCFQWKHDFRDTVPLKKKKKFVLINSAKS